MSSKVNYRSVEFFCFIRLCRSRL